MKLNHFVVCSFLDLHVVSCFFFLGTEGFCGIICFHWCKRLYLLAYLEVSSSSQCRRALSFSNLRFSVFGIQPFFSVFFYHWVWWFCRFLEFHWFFSYCSGHGSYHLQIGWLWVLWYRHHCRLCPHWRDSFLRWCLYVLIFEWVIFVFVIIGIVSFGKWVIPCVFPMTALVRPLKYSSSFGLIMFVMARQSTILKIRSTAVSTASCSCSLARCVMTSVKGYQFWYFLWKFVLISGYWTLLWDSYNMLTSLLVHQEVTQQCLERYTEAFFLQLYCCSGCCENSLLILEVLFDIRHLPRVLFILAAIDLSYSIDAISVKMFYVFFLCHCDAINSVIGSYFCSRSVCRLVVVGFYDLPMFYSLADFGVYYFDIDDFLS